MNKPPAHSVNTIPTVIKEKKHTKKNAFSDYEPKYQQEITCCIIL